jgi:hypothetical protein
MRGQGIGRIKKLHSGSLKNATGCFFERQPMEIDYEELNRYYASLSDEELSSLNREDLIETAQMIYDSEIKRRKLHKKAAGASQVKYSNKRCSAADKSIEDESSDPNWLQDGVCICFFDRTPGSLAEEKAAQARAALQEEGIPSRLKATQESRDNAGASASEILNVMVPIELALHAASILDRDLFNEEYEAEWRTHLNVLSDRNLLALDPEIFCAGLLDRVARIKKAYAEEMAKRNLPSRNAEL